MSIRHAQPSSQWSWSMPPLFGGRQFDSLHRLVTVNKETRLAVEGAYDRLEANATCVSMNNHEAQCGRPAIYEICPIPARLHNKSPSRWQNLLDEGEANRKSRIDAFPVLLKQKFPPAFVMLASKHLTAAGSADKVDWLQLHDTFFQDRIGRDVRDPPHALSELLEYSPGAVTHEEQDALCARLDELLERHYGEDSSQTNHVDAPSPG